MTGVSSQQAPQSSWLTTSALFRTPIHMLKCGILPQNPLGGYEPP
jgi:hypothetical protein